MSIDLVYGASQSHVILTKEGSRLEVTGVPAGRDAETDAAMKTPGFHAAVVLQRGMSLSE